MDKKNAFFILYLFGTVSLLGDIIYEGARSITGPYLSVLGASAVIVGFVAGLGELLGYVFRLFSGIVSDRTYSHWIFVFVGYGLLISVPLLAFADSWEVAAALFILERIGKGIRSPAKDALLSEPAKRVGTGFGFGILELVDQVGAFLGPFLLFIMFSRLNTSLTKQDYQQVLGLLWIPFILLMLTLLIAYIKFKGELQTKKDGLEDGKIGFDRNFWFYNGFVFFTTISFANFSLIGFHLKEGNIIPQDYIPLVYGFAMISDAILAILAGKFYDKLKNKKNILYSIPVFTFFSVSLVFSTNLILISISVFLWGLVMATHETLLKAYIVDTVYTRRATAFSIFNVIYGISAFIGSTLIGFLYGLSYSYLIIFLTVSQLLAVLFIILIKSSKN